MPTVDEMRIVMDAETARMMTKLDLAAGRVERFTRSSADSLRRFDGYIRSSASAVGILAGSLGTRQIIEYANAWTRTERALTASEDIFGMRLASAKDLVVFANEARVDVEAYAKTYFRTAAAIRDYGFGAAEAAKMTSALAMALKLGGAAASEQASVLLQYSQALNKGKLDGDEFRTVMENAPVIVELLSERLNASKGDIINWAREGKLQVGDLVGALTDGAGKIERLFKNQPQTIDESMTVLRNSLIAYVGERDKALGGSEKLIGLISGLANNIETVGDSALVLGTGLLTAFGPRVVSSIGAAAVGMGAAAGPLGLIAALVGGSAAAMELFGDHLTVTADGMVTLKDTALATMDVIGGHLTPVLDQASALWEVAVRRIQEALAGVPISFAEVAAAARAAVNATIGVFTFAAKSIHTAFMTLPSAIGEQFIAMANTVIEIVESLVRDVVEVLNVLPGIDITPEIDLSRIANPLEGSGAAARAGMIDAARQLGRDFVGEFGGAIGGIGDEIAARAREIAEMRQWAAGTTVDRDITTKRGALPVDRKMQEEQEKAYDKVMEVHRRALEAMGQYREVVVEEYQEELGKFQDMLDRKLISQQQFDDARQNLAIVAARKMNEAAEKEFQRLREVTDAVASNMQSAFDSFVEGGKVSIQDFTRSVLQDLAKIAFKMMVLQPLFGGGQTQGFGLLGSVLGLGSPGGASGGWSTSVSAFAEGGRPPVGRPSLVGERGPELFVPDMPGRIIPNRALGSGFGDRVGGEIIVTVVASPELHATIESTAEGVVARKAPAIVGASVDATRRNLPSMLSSAQRRSL